MEGHLAFAAIILGFLLFVLRARKSRDRAALPPGPFQWPLIGCLPSFPFHHRHRGFLELSKKFGPIVTMPIGSSKIFLVHGKDLAMEVLRFKDAQFSSRPLSMTGKYIGFEHSDPNLCPLNENWRVVRKAFSNELMAPSRLSSQAWLRREEVLKIVDSLLGITGHGRDWASVDVRKIAEGVVGRIIMRMLFGDHYLGKNIDNPDAGRITRELEREFEKYLAEGNFLWGELNLADYFPALGIFDLQGLEGRFKRLMSKLEPLFTMIIQEHRKNTVMIQDEKGKDVIDVLLQNQLSDKQIMGILSDALLPGIGTTSAAVEWAMAELAANPHTLSRAQQELDSVVGRSRLMDESAIPSLPYLQAIAKEVLRLHPSAPLDDPHLNEEESSLGGYAIPAKSTIFVNLWALGRDDRLWSDASRFDPDRFLGTEIGVHGSHFELLPFSSGRRRCPAHALAMIKLQHIVGALVHGFDWSSAGAVDLIEGNGIIASPRTPLRLRARRRLDDEAY
ncbi:hypothetical protein SELMODRAFT_166599 [Selaginella moellendorffii]|uniref:Uncharacterized protein CYP782A1 n=1 Tax=Selaginella moellendorffii TaxID=88036 RepID=D8QZ77_SELML|nr:flavonoid 3'-monooxygenase [Selaginella moellendorffii]EFJ34364.1 hypothetical protein SELMODRAFT_166599 [Selaginella moellendorffii]|eukprot:XP_002964031.1 flavonoid 3'-monooxygenase [Selaginella moellendorffii]